MTFMKSFSDSLGTMSHNKLLTVLNSEKQAVTFLILKYTFQYFFHTFLKYTLSQYQETVDGASW